MLELISTETTSSGITAVIKGPNGSIRFCDLVWITDRQDLLDVYYYEGLSVLMGAYHCCLSIPGKVTLL